MKLLLIILLISTIDTAVIVNPTGQQFETFEPTPPEKLLLEDRHFWYNNAEKTLKRNLEIEKEPEIPIAKNVIVFIGDGMGISTITSTRVYKGQRQFGKSGEDYRLIYEDFPHLALVKTYNVDMQVPDSAGTATALFTGVKTNFKVLGLDAKSNRTIFDKRTYETSKLESIITWAQQANKSTGIITTTRITHATPAATYSQINHRDWECDSSIPSNLQNEFKDIARQLIENEPGRNFNVIMGGGYQQLGYNKINETDDCKRDDNRNLTQLWLDYHQLNAKFVTNNQQLDEIGDDCDYLLGLFDAGHLPYELLRNQGPNGTPNLKQMLAKGLKVLKKNREGFVLVVEGGRIDHGHHDNYARLALEESVQFEEAIELALNQTGRDTLIVVTADHSHAMTMNGYANRGNDILGYGNDNIDEDMRPALTLTYANGPGFNYHYLNGTQEILGPWRDVRRDINRLIDPKYRHPGTFYVENESHGGEDVALFAKGPASNLFRGVIEQNYIAHVISYSACIGPRANLNHYCKNSKSIGHYNTYSILTILICIIISYF